MELLVYLIVLGLVFIGSIIAYFVVSKKNKILNNKTAILYYLCLALVISAFGFLGLIPDLFSSFLYFILLQVFFLGLGFLISWVWNSKMVSALQGQQGNEQLTAILFFTANAVIGMIGFTLIFYYCNPDNNKMLAPYLALSIVPFTLPQFIKLSFAAYREIPQEIYKIWYFPYDADEIDFDKIDTSTIYMLELEYSKSINSNVLSNSKLRAPIGMKFGDWFRSFVENYNYKYDNDPIQYLNDDRTPQGWIFYVKPSFFGAPKYIDPDKTIAENKLSEKRIIVAKRAGIIEEDNTNQTY